MVPPVSRRIGGHATRRHWHFRTRWSAGFRGPWPPAPATWISSAGSTIERTCIRSTRHAEEGRKSLKNRAGAGLADGCRRGLAAGVGAAA